MRFSSQSSLLLLMGLFVNFVVFKLQFGLVSFNIDIALSLSVRPASRPIISEMLKAQVRRHISRSISVPELPRIPEADSCDVQLPTFTAFHVPAAITANNTDTMPASNTRQVDASQGSRLSHSLKYNFDGNWKIQDAALPTRRDDWKAASEDNWRQEQPIRAAPVSGL